MLPAPGIAATAGGTEFLRQVVGHYGSTISDDLARLCGVRGHAYGGEPDPNMLAELAVGRIKTAGCER